MQRPSTRPSPRALAWSEVALVGFAMGVWLLVPIVGLVLQAIWQEG